LIASILIVDDDIHMGEIFHLILDREGHDVYYAQYAADAMRIALAIKPTIAFIDLRLPAPDISGVELIRLIKACTDCGDPILIVLTAASDQEIEAALEAGCVDVLRKPFLPSDLLAMVRHYSAN
jgi:DNA-binding response OmpR family regulator